MNHVIRSAVTAVLGTLLCLGCGDPLKEAQLIEEPRVLGVRIEGENSSSQVTPGAPMLVDLLLAGPTGPIDAEVAFRVCVGATSDRGVPQCRDEPFLDGTGLASDFPFLVELPTDVEDGARIVVLGVACLDSKPNLSEEPLASGCSGDDSPLRFSFETTVVSASEWNRNPDLTQVAVEMSGGAIPLDEIAAAPSCSAEIAPVAADEIHDLRVELGPAVFESGERLQVSLFSTEGHLERQFSFLDAGQTSFSVEFEASTSEDAVKQYLVVRDSRGGVAWVSWSFCQR